MAKDKNDVITKSTLGLEGRFGNQVFAYAFMKIYAKHYNLKIETRDWIGQYLFGHKDPPITKELPIVRPRESDLRKIFESKKNDVAKLRLKNVDLKGSTNYYSKYFSKYKKYFRSLFVPVPQIENEMNKGLAILRSKGNTIVGLHLRRGDYLDYKGHYAYFVAPASWYIEWLDRIWKKLDKPVLFIASDEPQSVIHDFAKFRPITSQDLNMYGKLKPEANFYPDFYLLSKCDILAISNSSFSFSASMLNTRCKLFLRPQQSTQKLIKYDPWDAPVKLIEKK
ncbi:alpha-1,2-fucosyltransferase [Paenibacillus silviterrae]|uniref:alpha-1,2-fucosyltransferase n=1 Tax=Paenibacillus silviterrae TaxID=3242194 RepID=UPI00254297BF|nr:alpha-1,2-fucosyltransferase [Paenibacillus chinjuensis]